MSALPNLPPNFETHEGRREPPRRQTWKTVVKWVALVLFALIIIVAGGVYILLHSPKLHQYVINKAQTSLSDQLQTQVNVRDFSLSWHGISPTLEIYGLTVAGAAPYTSPPILQVESVKAAVKVTSLLSRTWYLQDAEVHKPVLQVFVDKNNVSNIPKPKPSEKKSDKSGVQQLFDLGVRHAVIDNGAVFYNSRKSAISADLHDLTFHANFDTTKTAYSGDLSYDNGQLKIENYNPLPHALQATFVATEQKFELTSARLTSGQSSFAMKAMVDDYTNPKIHATYTAVVDAGEFRHVLKNPTVPVGFINTNGTLNYDSGSSEPMMKAIDLSGEIGSKVLTVQTPQFNGQVRNFGAKYAVNNGDARVDDIVANLLGGQLHGQLVMRDLAGNTRSQLSAKLTNVNAAAVKNMAASPALKNVNVAGSANADVNATWGKTMDDLVAKANMSLNGTVSPAQGANVPVSGAMQNVPVQGQIHATYTAKNKALALQNSYIHTPQTTLDLNGAISQNSALRVHWHSNLSEIAAIAAMFRAAVPGNKPLQLGGIADFNGTVSGSTAAPHLQGALAVNNLQVNGTNWNVLRTNLNVSPSQAQLQNGVLTAANNGGQLTFNINTELKKWSLTKTSEFKVDVDASRMKLAPLAQAAAVTTPITGTLNANVHLQGTQLQPTGAGTLDLTNASVGGEPINAANVRFNGTGDAVHALAKVQIPAGVANADITYMPKNEGYQLQLRADGIRLNQIKTIAEKNLGIAGVLNISASGQGTVKDPQLTASVQIPQLQMKNQTISNLNLQTNVANHVANATLDSSVISARIHGRARVNLVGDYNTDAQIDTERIDLAPLVAVYAPAQAGNLTGATELHATLSGPLKNKSAVTAHVTIPTLAVNYKKAVEIGAPQPIQLDYTNGVLNLQRTALRGTGTDLQLQGSVPVVGNGAMSVLLLGTIDLRLAQLVSSDITSSGQLRFNINSYGQRTDPNVEGQVQIVNANFTEPGMPVGMENGNGTLTLTRDRLNVDSFNARVGSGTLSARGGVLYRPGIQFDLALMGRGVRILLPQGVRTALDTDLTMTGTPTASLLQGTVNVEQLSFTPDFDLTSLGGVGGPTVPSPNQGFTSGLKLAITVRTPNGIDLVNRELSLAGNANLQVKGTASDPVVLGRVNLSSGDLIFQGNRYELQGGTVDFVNPSRTEPNLNVAVNTTIEQYNISMRFQGPVEHMRTSYTSDPALPPADIISLVAFGKTQEASAANPSPPGNLAAESAIASAVSGQVTNRVAKIAGISHLSIDPTLGGNQQNPGAVVTIQQRVTSKIFVTFSTDVTSTQQQTIQLQYKKSPRVSFSGTRDQNGGFGFDTRIRKTW